MSHNNDNIEDGHQSGDEIIVTIMHDNNIPYSRESMTWTLTVTDHDRIASSLLILVRNTIISVSYVVEDSRGPELGLPNPVARATVEALEKIRFEGRRSDIGQSGSTTCPICMEEFELGLEITRTHCSHVFHGDCLAKWIERSNTCPLCRLTFNTNI